jgi:hypothetical protein
MLSAKTCKQQKNSSKYVKVTLLNRCCCCCYLRRSLIAVHSFIRFDGARPILAHFIAQGWQVLRQLAACSLSSTGQASVISGTRCGVRRAQVSGSTLASGSAPAFGMSIEQKVGCRFYYATMSKSIRYFCDDFL